MSEDRKPSSSTFISLDEGGSAQPPRRGRHRGVLAGVVAVACVALIVVSLGFVHPGADGGWSVAWLFQTTTEEVSAAGSAQGDAAGSATAMQGSDTAASAGDDAVASSSSAQAASDAVTHSDASNGGSGSAGDNGAAGASGGASSGASSNDSNVSDMRPQQPATITVYVSVDSSSVGSPVSAGGTVTLDAGATAFDALRALGVSCNAQGSQYGVYVSSIGGLAEKEHGSTSGWVYYVNGSFANTSASNYALADGDTVQWVYSVSE